MSNETTLKFEPKPFSPEELVQIVKDTKTGQKPKSIELEGKFATDKTLKDLFQMNLEVSHTLLALKYLNVKDPASCYKDNVIMKKLPDVQPKNPRNIEHNAKGIAQGIEKINKGLTIE